MTLGPDHRLALMNPDCARLRTLLEELPEFEHFDPDEFVPHLESCATCSAGFPEVRALLGLGSTVVADADAPGDGPAFLPGEVLLSARPEGVRGTTRLRRVAATAAAAGIFAAFAAGLFRADRDAQGPSAPLHSHTDRDRDQEQPAVVSSLATPPATRIDGTTRWTQVSYASGPSTRSILQTTISRPNRRIRAKVTR